MDIVGHESDIEILQRLGYELLSPMQGEREPPKVESGGFGLVYKVRNRHSGLRFAAKTLQPKWRTHERLRESFRQEADLLMGLIPNPKWITDPPNDIVSAYEHIALADSSPHDLTTGTTFLLIEYIEGTTLQNLIARTRGLTIPQTLAFAKQFCRGMEYCQFRRHDFVHRDIKPGNMMVTLKGTLKIIDFGLSRSVGHRSGLTTLVACSPPYASDEQMGGRKYGIESDVFSFGASIVEMLSGTPARERGPARKQLEKIPPELNLLVDVVLKCLSKSPGDRYRTFSQLRMELVTLQREFVDPWARRQGYMTCPSCGFISEPTVAPCLLCGQLITAPRAAAVGRAASQNDTTVPVKDLRAESPTRPSASVAPASAFVRVPVGIFTTGCSETFADQLIARFDFHPRTKAQLLQNPAERRTITQAISISKCVVTNQEFWDFVRQTGCQRPAGWTEGLSTPFPEDMGNYPVTGVSWHDAVAYCTHYGYRLPTDDEWERVARGTTGRLYAWGNEFNYKHCNGKELKRGRLVPADYLEEGKSEDGLYNLTGNVWEWTEPSRLLSARARGGSFRDSCELAALTFFDQFSGEPDGGRDNAGFRVYRPAAPTDPETLDVHGHTLVKIPGGQFKAGIPSSHAQRLGQIVAQYGFTAKEFLETFKEQSHHLPAFYISKSPVTNQDYLAFTRESGHGSPEHWLSGHTPFLKAEARLPVVNVSSLDASAFCRWFAPDCRLPTDLEWEKAARGTDGRLFPWGDAFDPGACQCAEAGATEIVDVDSDKCARGPYGTVGMAGNVWEWVWPVNTRGGSFRYPCEVYGLGFFGMARSAAQRDSDIGFRCVKDG